MIRVALLDGALPSAFPDLAAQRRFAKADGAMSASVHALAMATTIHRHAPHVNFVNGIIFPGRLVTSVAVLCDALEWIGQDPPEIVHCSFGLARASLELEMRVRALEKAGSLIVASAPARGEPVYPAALEGVVSVQGDARCKPEDVARLDLPGALFGACVISPEAPDIRGASIAAAHVCGMLAADWAGGAAETLRVFAHRTRYHGCERRIGQAIPTGPRWKTGGRPGVPQA